MFQFGAQAKISKSWVIILQKTVKYYTYCKNDYHTKNKCLDKYPYLKKVKLASAKSGTKERRNRKPVKDKQGDNNLEKGFYFIQPKLESFMAISANPFLSKL